MYKGAVVHPPVMMCSVAAVHAHIISAAIVVYKGIAVYRACVVCAGTVGFDDDSGGDDDDDEAYRADSCA
eukprot:2165888-Pyramimonas_sp.AAC.1